MVAALLAALSFPPGRIGLNSRNEADGQPTRGPECDSAADCASALLAQVDEGPKLPAPRIIDVAGVYTVTATGVLMPGTEGALRVIEFTADGASEQEEP